MVKEWDNKCPYCDNTFGDLVSRKVRAERCGDVVGVRIIGYLTPTLDHIVPRAFGGLSNESNLVASCQICNALKQDKVFTSYTRLILYLEDAWKRKGYSCKPVLRIPE